MISLPPSSTKPQCRHKNDADDCLLCGTRKKKRVYNVNLDRAPEQHSAPRLDRPLTPQEKTAILEEKTRRLFGLSPVRPIEDRLDQLTNAKKPRIIFNGLREALRLDRQDIVDLFDRVIDETVRLVEDEVPVENAVLERRVAKLKKLVQASKDRIDSWSIRVMKIRREDDNILDKKTREKFKRDENARITRCNMKLARYRAALRNGGYREKVWRYASVPTYFRDIIDDNMTFKTDIDTKYVPGEVKYVNGTPTHRTTNLVTEYIESGVHNLALYRRVLKLGEDALEILGETESEQKISWDNWREWEDAVIETAIRCGLIRVSPELAGVLGLTTELVPDEIEADTTEDALALKTGGACYDGRIRGGGVRFRNGKFRQRAVESFDKSPTLGQYRMDWESSSTNIRNAGSHDFESPVL